MSSYLLQEAQTDNGNVAFTPDAIGNIELYVVGTWDSGSVKIQQLSPDGTNYVDITSALTADGRVLGILTHKNACRVNVASVAGAAADLDIYIGGPSAVDITRSDN